MIDFYTFNIFTFAVDIVVTFFSLSTLFIVIEEQKKLKQMRLESDKKTKYGGKQ